MAIVASSDVSSTITQSEGEQGGSWSHTAPHYAGRLATSTVNAAKKMVDMALELKPLAAMPTESPRSSRSSGRSTAAGP
ncbi:hypothetical protein PG996_005847 [Apiospora saccharicola]|uniref:Uncharacterized protein n=1 Tax=Apiospora saccharicola TaxID=335842 RepID=A0ABR1VRF7_9PEZI